MNYKYKKENNLEIRKQESKNIKENYPTRIPVICEKDPKCTIQPLAQTKFLVPYDTVAGSFIFTIRKKLNLDDDSGLYLLVNGKISITGSQTMNEIYQNYKDPEDDFLYITYSCEQFWG